MKSRLFPILVLIGLLLAVGGLFLYSPAGLFATAHSSPLPAPSPTGTADRPPVPVEAVEVKVGTLTRVRTYAGALQPILSLDVTTKYSDRVVEVEADVGDAVQKGDLLLVFDTTALQLQLTQAGLAVTTAEANLAKMRRGARPEQVMAAQAALNLAQANLARIDTVSDAQIEAASSAVNQTQAALKLAQAEYDRISWAGDVGDKPQAVALEQATAAYETAMAQYTAALKGAPIERLALESALLQAQSALALAREPFVPEDFTMAEAELKNAEAALALLKTQRDDAHVEAPIDGLVAARHVSAGESPGLGSPLVTLVSAEVEAVIAVDEGQIGQVYLGQPAALRVTAFPGRDFPGTVTQVSPTADAKTHTFTVKVRPADEAGLLKAGMFAEVTLLVEERADVLQVPQAAVITAGGETSVFVIKDGQAHKRSVTLGTEQEYEVEVISGLAAGEWVVVTGLRELTEGTPVNIASAEEVYDE